MLLCVSIFGIAASAQADDNILINGSFQTPRLTNPERWRTFTSSSADFPTGWYNASGAYVEIQQAGIYNSGSNGAQSDQWAEIDAPGQTTLWQFIPEADGTDTLGGREVYDVEFSYSARPYQGQQEMAVVWGTTSYPEVKRVSGSGSGQTVPVWSRHYISGLAGGQGGSWIGFQCIQCLQGAGNLLDWVRVVKRSVSTPPQATPTPTPTQPQTSNCYGGTLTDRAAVCWNNTLGENASQDPPNDWDLQFAVYGSGYNSLCIRGNSVSVMSGYFAQTWVSQEVSCELSGQFNFGSISQSFYKPFGTGGSVTPNYLAGSVSPNSSLYLNITPYGSGCNPSGATYTLNGANNAAFTVYPGLETCPPPATPTSVPVATSTSVPVATATFTSTATPYVQPTTPPQVNGYITAREISPNTVKVDVTNASGYTYYWVSLRPATEGIYTYPHWDYLYSNVGTQPYSESKTFPNVTSGRYIATLFARGSFEVIKEYGPFDVNGAAAATPTWTPTPTTTATPTRTATAVSTPTRTQVPVPTATATAQATKTAVPQCTAPSCPAGTLTCPPSGNGCPGGCGVVCINPGRPECNDQVDNDGDGATDFPADFSCSGPQDDNETDPKSQCQDGLDNDKDGLTDLADPDCNNNPQNNSEKNKGPAGSPECSDGLDNEGDGATDYLQDFSCGGNPVGGNEAKPEAQCQNKLDDDTDGKIDAGDPDCESPQDNNEAGGAAAACVDSVNVTIANELDQVALHLASLAHEAAGVLRQDVTKKVGSSAALERDVRRTKSGAEKQLDEARKLTIKVANIDRNCKGLPPVCREVDNGPTIEALKVNYLRSANLISRTYNRAGFRTGIGTRKYRSLIKQGRSIAKAGRTRADQLNKKAITCA